MICLIPSLRQCVWQCMCGCCHFIKALTVPHQKCCAGLPTWLKNTKRTLNPQCMWPKFAVTKSEDTRLGLLGPQWTWNSPRCFLRFHLREITFLPSTTVFVGLSWRSISRRTAEVEREEEERVGWAGRWRRRGYRCGGVCPVCATANARRLPRRRPVPEAWKPVPKIRHTVDISHDIYYKGTLGFYR